jgi:parallel beta-helix repeat (two copies)
MKYEILSFRANHIVLKGFKIINSGEDEVENIGAIRLYNSQYTTIEDNIFENNYFGIYIQRGYKCLIQNNKITSTRAKSQEGSGDGIHAWVSQEIWIKIITFQVTKTEFTLKRSSIPTFTTTIR